MARKQAPVGEPITIKKYANRRLYNTATSSYVTLDDLCGMVKEGIEFTVHDAKTGEDITRSVLTQIIVEEEGKGHNLLPIGFLRKLISFYGDSLEGLLPRYLEESMSAFIQNQEQMRNYVQSTFGGIFPFNQVEEMGKRNMAMMEQTMKVFAPESAAARTDGQAATKAKPEMGEGDRFDELQDKIDALQQQLEELGKAGGRS